MKNTAELLSILTLKNTDNNNFKGISKDIGSPIVFGGQVLAQSLNAAYRTVSDERILHSLHSYFLEAGNLELPIIYNVQVIRDGGSFSTRRVTASQNDKTIFILACSFHKKEEGYQHQKPIKKDIKQPEELLSWSDMLVEFDHFLPKKLKAFLSIDRPIDFKPVHLANPLDLKNLPAVVDVWFKLKDAPSNLTLALKQQILTYISDYNLLTACLNPNASVANFGNTQMASLDHSMWFHRDFDFSDWLLFSIESPSASGARGFATGNIYTRKGVLVASVAQEGLMRAIKKKES
ncbi:acyl-CoA thioesterase II [Tenacibaculum finnmarkense genomovar finnmarkense]|uniref:acyl-CoA thioesterase n=1 Tax=Tenacibaculum finnmarkense TaxID=2781243 RepID=UPI001E2986D9|nr:acyl-CoA thioesterase II [Tenacibaculum finnmarkense]MCD8416810.1 acyl-CoA thioesterase II [Tenacibaculum finnmarkense genomovar finnmarkense]MCG8184793.1 acyl-CoA thioesterase II [Tenacibaculum finnmarkense genomovar finnmarkense]MCG8201591.1 acyl-CoA thioesterase II [Tenacibaculum finnmarkense genomovar finnmarkense]MCG8208501.1 acyl-CoA thioesterase II [Tenacibaculum finnmarkense genomovar finnmarkense]MCG8211233.1 acyl-CoA thioesterase II [Tenacibaculum finnmarkense genomovar finnmarken